MHGCTNFPLKLATAPDKSCRYSRRGFTNWHARKKTSIPGSSPSLAESLIQCIAGGLAGITLGFLVALALRTYTPFPASVQTWVAALGVFLSSAVGLFFGIYPALRASRLDPVVALRSD